MTPQQLLDHCLGKPGAWADNPWDHEHPVVKVHDKIFAFVVGKLPKKHRPPGWEG